MTTNWQQKTERFAAISAKLHCKECGGVPGAVAPKEPTLHGFGRPAPCVCVPLPDWARRIAGVRSRLTPELCPRCLGLGVHLTGCSRIKRALVPALELAASKAALRGERLMGALASALTCAWCGEPGTHADCIDAESQAEAEKEQDREAAELRTARAATSLGRTGADWLDVKDGVSAIADVAGSTTRHPDLPSEANARLIAAAPDLLAALDALLHRAAMRAALRGERLMGALDSALTCAWCGEPGTHADCIDAESQAEAEKEADRDAAELRTARAATSLGRTGADWLDVKDGVS